jgi:RNA polymerase sigma-70 factor, ECF subfamily
MRAVDDESGTVESSDAPMLVPTPREDFDTFDRREHGSVTALAYVLSGSRTVAEELTQEAFVDAFRRWDRLGSYDAPGAWVRRAVANRAVSAYRRRMSEARALLRLGVRRVPIVELTEPTEDLWAVVRQLPQRQAQAIALHYLHELSIAEVAEVIECSVPTVKTHLQRGRLRLAELLHTFDPACSDLDGETL